METPEFIKFSKIPRLNRPVIITEKLDGTNAQICITPDGDIFTGSRNRWITPEDDNHGFAKWVAGNKDTVLKLGPGRHFGEWIGQGIQRNYGLKEKRFYLFNVGKWNKENTPEGIHVVPVIHTCPCGLLMGYAVNLCMRSLEHGGSLAVPGFMNPEGIVAFHSASGTLFKRTFEHDDEGKPPELESA